MSGALESYYRYLIFQRTSYRLVDRHEDRVDMKNARDHKRGPGTALPTSNNHSSALAPRAEVIPVPRGLGAAIRAKLESPWHGRG